VDDHRTLVTDRQLSLTSRPFMTRLIVEIKARCDDHDRIRSFLTSRRAVFRGTDRQVDTYFKVNHGRLKLREGTIENFLVCYDRANTPSPKRSDVILFKSDPGSSLKAILTRALGVLVVVEKVREISFIDNVKFHVDVVSGLGTFVEIEAIDSDGSIDETSLRDQCHGYLTELGIADRDLVSVSYSDLLLQQA
jgi:predicted adenylyl cyclase CyaB